MSYIDARDQLRAAGRELGYTDDDGWADTLLARHAHELAEGLRDAIGRPDYPGESEWVKRYVEGWRDAAKTIDPVKKAAPNG